MIILFIPSLEESMMWPGTSAPAPILESRIEREWLMTDEGPVEMWFVPASGFQSSANPTVICAHGNAEVIDWTYLVMKPYLEIGINLALCEYRGYGRSKGTPSQKHITFDFTACYDWIIQKLEVDSTRIFFQGTSIGTGVVCALARKRRPKLLILISPFINTGRWIQDKNALFYQFIKFFGLKNPFFNDRFLKTCHSPVLIFHGRKDEIIPFSHGRYLHENSPDCRFIDLDSGHNDVLSHSTVFWTAVRRFLAEQDVISSDFSG